MLWSIAVFFNLLVDWNPKDTFQWLEEPLPRGVLSAFLYWGVRVNVWDLRFYRQIIFGLRKIQYLGSEKYSL